MNRYRTQGHPERHHGRFPLRLQGYPVRADGALAVGNGEEGRRCVVVPFHSGCGFLLLALEVVMLEKGRRRPA